MLQLLTTCYNKNVQNSRRQAQHLRCTLTHKATQLQLCV